jgi:hypothetical protein
MNRPRDLSTILWRCGRFSVIVDPRNLLAGFRLDPGVIVAHLTVFGFRWEWRKPDGSGRSRTVADVTEQPSGWLMPGAWHA